MTLRLGGDGAITGCTSLENPDLTVSGLTISGSFDAEKVLVASGTAAAPSYTFSGDTDNGLYYAGTNSIGLSTAGTNAILIDSSGKVGIGTTSPSQALEVNGSILGNNFLAPNPATYGVASNTRIGIVPTTATNERIEFHVGASERARIDSSGRLLVGTTSTSTASRLILQGLSNNAAAGAFIHLQRGNLPASSGSPTGSIIFADNSSNEGARINTASEGAWTSGVSHPGRLVFLTTSAGASSSTERMRIDSSGLIGIGRTPDSTYSQYALQVRSNTDDGSLIHLSRPSDGTSTANDGFLVGLGTDPNSYVFNREPGNLIFGTNNAERMRILSTGGLTFNGDTAASNALDDYEEGTFTPTFLNGGSAVYAIRNGSYVKVGAHVTATIFVQLSSVGSASGSIVISGFPFPTKNVSNLYAVSSSIHGTGWSTTRNSVNAIISPNGTSTNSFYYNMAAAGSTYGQVTHADLGTGNILLTFSYIANT